MNSSTIQQQQYHSSPILGKTQSIDIYTSYNLKDYDRTLSPLPQTFKN